MAMLNLFVIFLMELIFAKSNIMVRKQNHYVKSLSFLSVIAICDHFTPLIEEKYETVLGVF